MSDASGGRPGEGRGGNGGAHPGVGGAPRGGSWGAVVPAPLRAGLRRSRPGAVPQCGACSGGEARGPPASGSAPQALSAAGGQEVSVRAGASLLPGSARPRPGGFGQGERPAPHRGEGFWRREGPRAGTEPLRTCPAGSVLCPFSSSSLIIPLPVAFLHLGGHIGDSSLFSNKFQLFSLLPHEQSSLLLGGGGVRKEMGGEEKGNEDILFCFCYSHLFTVSRVEPK